MFQASFLKRASRLAPPAAAVGVAVVIANTWGNVEDVNVTRDRKTNVALCDGPGKQDGSVLGMLGDIQTKVRRSRSWKAVDG